MSWFVLQASKRAARGGIRTPLNRNRNRSAIAGKEQPMQRHTATEFGRLVKRVEEKTLHPARLNIGSRLILCFVFIILVMLGADAVVLWQFQVVHAQAERLNGIDQKLVTLLRVHASLLEFYAGLEAIAQTEDADLLVKEAGALRTVALNDIQHAVSSFSLLPSDLQRDP